MARERACVAIANLLVDHEWAEVVRKSVIRWMKAQVLESVAAIGLLVFLRAKIESSSFAAPPIEELSSGVSRPSLLSSMLMRELLGSGVPALDWATLNSGSAPSGFKPEPFFEKHSRNVLPRQYANMAEKIEANSKIPFTWQWAFEWHKILERIGKEPSVEPLHFWVTRDPEYHAALDVELSEVYRSAYLRSLAWAVMVGGLSENDARFLTMATCPLDLGLWRVSPVSKPEWWPRLGEPESQIDTAPAEIWRQVADLWQKQPGQENEWVVSEASGRIHEGSAIYDLQIFGLFQRCEGPSRPDFDELTEWNLSKVIVEHKPCSLRLQGRMKATSLESMVQRFGDWSVAPAACRAALWTTPRWQFWRAFRGIWLPAPFLASNSFSFKCSQDGLFVRDGEQIVGKWSDWTDGLGEKMTTDVPPSTGQYLLVRRQLIDEFAAKNRCVFCWVCRLSGYLRAYDYQPYQTFVTHHHFGGSSIVMP